MWDIPSGDQLLKLTGHTQWLFSLALLPNGWLASGSWDKTIKLWDLDQKKEVGTLLGHTSAVLSLKVLKNGHLVSYSLDNTLKIWNPYLEGDNLVRTIQGHGNTYWPFPLFDILSNDFIVTCSRDKVGKEECVLMVHDPANGKKTKSIPTVLKGVRSLLVLLNDQVAIGFENGSIQIFNLNGGETRAINQAHDSFVRSLFQLSNGSLVSSGTEKRKITIKMWNLADFSLLQTIQTDHENIILSIDVSKDEAFLATGSEDKSIKIWPLLH